MTTLRLPKLLTSAEMAEARRARVWIGAGYGFLGATVYAWLAGTIDWLTVRDLPMQVDWSRMLTMWLLVGIGVAAFSAVTAWPREQLSGVLVGAAALALVVFGVTLFTTLGRPLASFILTLLAFGPMTVLCVPAAFTLRWLTQRHLEAQAEKNWRGVATAMVAMLLLGAIPGVTARLSAQGQTATRAVHTLLQAAEVPPVFSKLPDFMAHAGTPYHLTAHPSIISTEGYDVSATFIDGYRVTCVAVAVTGQKPFVRGCAEGATPPR